ncbi:uncharacterized protein DAT39_023323, partial [Clarias magur]
AQLGTEPVVKNAGAEALLKQYVLSVEKGQGAALSRHLCCFSRGRSCQHLSCRSCQHPSAGHDVALAALHASALATGRAGALAAACADALAAACADALAAACADALAAACADALAAACASALAAACASALAAACASVSAAVASTSGSSIPVSRLTPSKSTICGLSDTLEEKEKMDDQQIMEVTAAVEQQVAASMTERPSRPPTARVMLAAPQDELILPEAWKRSLPVEQQEWVSKAIFVLDQTGRAVLSQDLKLWYYPPGPRSNYSQCPSNHYAFFQRPFVLWAPYHMWKYKFECPFCSHKLTGCGLYNTVRKVLDRDGWYFMGTEYLEC